MVVMRNNKQVLFDFFIIMRYHVCGYVFWYGSEKKAEMENRKYE